MESLKYLGYGILGVGAVLAGLGYAILLLAIIFGVSYHEKIFPQLISSGWGIIFLGLIVLFLYVLFDRLKEMKKDDLGNHTRY
ncbi:MAG: hypothetical protein ABH950_00585 [Candidatus Altiarchaeota archaeon]